MLKGVAATDAARLRKEMDGRHGSGAPNEFIVVEPKSRIAGLGDVGKFYIDCLLAFAEMR